MSGELEVRVAGADTLEHSESISDRIRFEVEAGAIGMALRSPELIRERMLSGDALLALYSSRGRKGPPPHRAATCGPPPPRRLLGAERLWRGQTQPPAGCEKRLTVTACGIEGVHWVGFCYLSPWEDGRFVSTSALIVKPSHRGQGVARALKAAALSLARTRYPGARPFGLSTSDAVARINLSLGFREAAYREITGDPAFWKGCETCPLHATLLRNRGETCHCRAMLGEPRARSLPGNGS